MSRAHCESRRHFFAALFALHIGFTVPAAAAESAQSLYEKGIKAKKESKAQQAVNFLKAAVAADPQYFLAFYELAQLATRYQRPDLAVEFYEKTVAAKPDFAEAHRRVCLMKLLHDIDKDHAFDSCKRALLVRHPYVDPNHPLRNTWIETLALFAGEYWGAQRHGLTVGILDSMYGLAEVNRELVQPDRFGKESRQLLEEALQQDFAQELHAISAQLHGGRAADAVRLYEAFLKAHPIDKLKAADRWDLCDGLGLSRMVLGKPDAAARDFKQAATAAEGLRYGQWQESMWHLAGALAESGKLDEAVAALEPVLFVDLITSNDAHRSEPARYQASLTTDPMLKKLQAHPGFKALLATYVDLHAVKTD